MHLHLVGIGGTGISAIAYVLLGRGFVVSGSDLRQNEQTAALKARGAMIYQGHQAEYIAGADALVISSAIPTTNPEVQAAQLATIPVFKRADFLGHLMADKVGIAVAGSHGKTTTTGMIAQVLLAADLDPTVIVGGVLPALGTNGRYGKGPHFVIEADEYDYMFLGLRPSVAIITSVEHDHPDLFPTLVSYQTAFQDFVALLPPTGHLILCADDEGTRHLLAKVANVRRTMYQVESETTVAQTADFRAIDLRQNQLGGTDFLVEHQGKIMGLIRLRVPGIHNVQNALAAIVVAVDMGVEFNVLRQALAEFGGVGRRFQIVGQVGGVTIVDDYAHHPTAIRVTLMAARQRFPGRRLWAIWQPHTFTRTKLLLVDFAMSFSKADRVVALDIYGSREKDTLGLDMADIVTTMRHQHAVYIPKRREAATYLLDRVRPDDVIVLLGAGDVNVIGEWILDGLRQRVEW